ncbi:hypothetical protein GA830_09185 [Mesorhizobium sp. NBSH29]|uniref:BrnT family toxin n=1 Tax=Mesorhizobium sp. NBSH29 TaxID=2654249 RepID=UPI00189691BD|nr:BrnT family toxin [Mesorhizobium sp. NBSH29]QPC86890.1 hypothetical protein GA830_09185 [Mesorhizobium sp. NBSH29]
MKIVWDEPKRLANLAKHGLDFAVLDDLFFLDAIVQPARVGRFKAIGELEPGMVLAVIFHPMGSEGLSIISMRPARLSERRLQ